MSEPFSAVAQVTIDRDALIAYLDAAPIRASNWSDWPRIGGEWIDFSWDRNASACLAHVDARLGAFANHREAVRHLIEADIVAGTQRCQYDTVARRFTFATLMFAPDVEEVALFFATARGIATFADKSDTGFAVMHDYLFSTTLTVAAMQLGPYGGSRFLDPRMDVTHPKYVRDAVAVFDDIKAAGGAPGRVIDELDQIR